MKNKKLLILGIICIVCIIGLGYFMANKNDQSKDEKLYITILEQLLGNTDYSQYNFALCDVDGNEHLELLVCNGVGNQSYVDIFTIYNEEVHYIGYFGSKGQIKLAYQQNLIDSHLYLKGIYYNEYYKIENNKAILLDKLASGMINKNEQQYALNDKIINHS